MRIIGTVIILLLLICTGALAQGTKLEWAKHNTGNSGQNSVLDMVVSDSGFVYLTGYFSDTVDFDPGPDSSFLVSASGRDIFIQKLAPNGDLVWVKQLGSTALDEAYGIALDHLGNVYVTGTFTGIVDFNPGAAANNLTANGTSNDVFVLKLTAAGNYSWAYRIGSSNSDIGYDIAVNPTGVYVTGAFIGTADFNPGGSTANLSSNGTLFSDFFIQKVTLAGAYVWAKKVGGTEFDVTYGITLDAASNVYVTGYFSTAADFDPNAGIDTLFASPSRDVFILKLNSAGNYIWAKQLDGSIFNSQGRDIAVDVAQNVYLTGYFVSKVDFDPGTDSSFMTPLGGTDPFILKLDSAGSFVWAKQLAGISSDQGRSLAIDREGSIYTTGYFSGTVDFDPGIGTNNITSANNGSGWDVYVHKLDSIGQLIWVRAIGGKVSDRGEAIWVDTLGNVFFAGSYSDTADFDPTINVFELTTPSTAPFVAKWSQCAVSYFTIDTATCYSYTSPNGQVYTASGTYADTLVNAVGCDSFVVLNLIIIDTARQTITQQACDSFELNGQVYTASGTYTQSFTSAAGCDSILTLELTIDTILAAVTQTEDTLISTNTGATYQWLDCNNGYDTIAGANNSIFIPTLTGDYAVAVSANGCTDTSACYTVTITTIGIEESFGQHFTLYPNPTDGKCTITLGAYYGEITVTVNSIAGQVISTQQYHNRSAIDMALDIPAGMYLVTLSSAQGKRVLKLVVE